MTRQNAEAVAKKIISFAGWVCAKVDEGLLKQIADQIELAVNNAVIETIQSEIRLSEQVRTEAKTAGREEAE